MKFILVNTMLFCCWVQVLQSQDTIRQRVILIGDAGEVNVFQKAVMQDAAKRAMPGKTVALFLGDNIYSSGMALEATTVTETEDILRNQYQPLRQAGIPVYFVPGNHDWDHSGVKGYEKIMRVNEFIQNQQDSSLQMIPKDACPGPYELAVTDELVIVAIDSEWWLFPFDKHTEPSDCECKTPADILGKLEDVIQRNKNKTIIFASHHPFKTYGSHGGYYNLREHIFPLTDLNKSLYIPLPIIGSLYPLLRTSFPPPEDVKNMLYQDMKIGIENVLKQHPNVIHASGHEHALQLIQGAVLEVVSGAGCKNTPVKSGDGTLYAESNPGYVVADLLANNTLHLTFYSYDKGSFKNSYNYDKAHTVPAALVSSMDVVPQGDSISVPLPGNYDKVGKLHRKLFGQNYRTVWATAVKLPVLRLSGKGLTPTERGGGMQTHSLRMEDAAKKEWVLRSVDKYPDALLPRVLANTFAAAILKDNVTAAFPYAPLVVPTFADALKVPHSNPTIVYVAPDKSLGIYNKDFANTITLFEEREPLGKSISTLKMMEKLKEDNDNAIDQRAFTTARLLDIFLGDWDRHADQWRWIDAGKKKSKLFQPVPRDRDQVFYINQGFIPKIFSLPWLQPKFQGFGDQIININTFSFNARAIDGLFTNQLGYEDWMNITNESLNKLTDTLIASALTKIPEPVYTNIHQQLERQLKNRRADLLKKSPQYFRFLNRDIDITLTDKKELVNITDTTANMLILSVHKLSATNEAEQQIYHRVFDPAITKELRLYLFGGNDSIIINNNSSPIKLRIVGDGKASKSYQVNGARSHLRKIHIYEGVENAHFAGDPGKAHLHLSGKQENTAFAVTERYNKTIPSLSIGYNADDGFVLGAGVTLVRQGFRKSPYAATHQFNLSYSFYTRALGIRLNSEWLKAIGGADLLNATILAPEKAQNFFGRGNETGFNDSGDFRAYYRTVFTTLQADPALRWRSGSKNSFTIGPSFQYYHFDAEDNKGRFINKSDLINSYDSATISNDKSHLGITVSYVHDSRNDLLLPSGGTFLNLKLKGYEGLNNYSKSFVQVTSELAVFKAMDRRGNLVIANRIGGGASFGSTAFYQSLFLGGQNNLYGYRQFRFAGQHMLYNNIEARIKIANIASYLVPGQFGLMGFYDVGRVWENDEQSKKWHQGVGGGIYFAPARLLLLQFVVGKSIEGWYPVLTMGFRF